MKPARGVITAATAGLLVGLVTAGALSADPQSVRPNIELRCAQLAEDSAAHVRLIEYGPSRIVYACDERASY